MTLDRKFLEAHDRQIALLTDIQSKQARLLANHDEQLARLVEIQEVQARTLGQLAGDQQNLADAIRYLADRIGASH